jgi:hypothetical protein
MKQNPLPIKALQVKDFILKYLTQLKPVYPRSGIVQILLTTLLLFNLLDINAKTTGDYRSKTVYDIKVDVSSSKRHKGTATSAPTFSDGQITVSEGHTTLLGLEVTQVIQDLENNIPLIAGKKTIVRAYFQSASNSEVSFNSSNAPRLFGKRISDGTDLGSIKAKDADSFDADPFIVPGKADNDQQIEDRLKEQRADLDKSLNFDLPELWTVAGTVELRLKEVLECKEATSTANGIPDCKATIIFNPSKILPIKVINTTWTDISGITPTKHSIPHNIFRDYVKEVEKTFMSLFPISKIDITGSRGHIGNYDFGAAMPADKPYRQLFIKINKKLTTLQSLEPNRLYLAFVDGPDPINPYGRSDTIGGVAATIHIGSPTITTSAHEIGHLLGRIHVAGCATDGTFDTAFPDDNVVTTPRIGPMNRGIQKLIYGYHSIDDYVIDPESAFELMSYCSPHWISDYTYKKINTSISTRFPNVATFSSTNQLASLNNNNLANIAQQATTITQQAIPYRFFRGTINLDNNEIVFDPVILLSSNTEPTPLPLGEYQLQLINEQNVVIKTIDFKPKGLYREDESEPRLAYFNIPVNLNKPAIKAIILKNNIVIGQITASENAPTVKVLFPNGGESLSGIETSFEWKANDTDGDELTYGIQYSNDGGSTWETLDIDLSDAFYEVDLSSLGKTGMGLLRVVVSDGFNVAMDESDGTFNIANSTPEAYIITPLGSAVFVGKESIFFKAIARDIEDGDLTGTSVSWSSSLDGFLGNGETFYKPANLLKEGEHLITLNATDKAGASVKDSVKIKVYRSTPHITQIITFAPIPDKTFGDAPFTLIATASSGLPVSFSIVSGPATISNSTLTITGAGTITVSASQTGNGTYKAAPDVIRSFKVAKASQTISFAGIPDKTVSDAPFPVQVSASSGLPVVLSVISGPATISGNTVTLTGTEGVVTIRAQQPGNGNYHAATPVQRSFNVGQSCLPPAITSQPQAAAKCVGEPVSFSVTAIHATGYQWRKNGVNIAGATTSTYSIASVTATDAGNYSVVVNGTCTPAVTSAEAILTVNPYSKVSIPDAKALPEGVAVNTVYLGYTPAASLTLTAQASAGTAPYQYQWQENGLDIASATSASLKVSPTTTTTYSVRVSASNACATTADKEIQVVDVRCGPNQNKVAVCHRGQSLCIDATSVKDHLAHGDKLGDCSNTNLPTIAINHVTLYESQGQATLFIGLSRQSALPVTVRYETSDGTAQSPKDYKAAKGNITIPAGSIVDSIHINISSDNITENEEYFDVLLSNPINGVLSGMGKVTIIDGKEPIAKANNTTSIYDQGIAKQKLRVNAFPNPTGHYFTLLLQSKNTAPATIKIMDILGRIVETRAEITPNSSLMFGHNYHTGIYYVEVIQANERVVMKIIKR